MKNKETQHSNIKPVHPLHAHIVASDEADGQQVVGGHVRHGPVVEGGGVGEAGQLGVGERGALRDADLPQLPGDVRHQLESHFVVDPPQRDVVRRRVVLHTNGAQQTCMTTSNSEASNAHTHTHTTHTTHTHANVLSRVASRSTSMVVVVLWAESLRLASARVMRDIAPSRSRHSRCVVTSIRVACPHQRQPQPSIVSVDDSKVSSSCLRVVTMRMNHSFQRQPRLRSILGKPCSRHRRLHTLRH